MHLRTDQPLMDAFSNQSVFQRLIKEQRAIPLDAAHGFALFFILTGIGAVIVNSVILLVLYFKRRNIFTNVFYIMILNFVLIDILKGACSIVWALKLLPGGASASILFMKVDQFALMILRFTNLATILNLLLITLNEFIFIVYPLRYGHIVTRIRVTMLIVFGWISSWLFTISLLLIGSHKQSVYIRPNCYPKDSTTLNSTEHANISSCLVRSSRSLDSQFVFNVGVIVFCFICLLICVICYVILIRVIARIVRIDSKMLSNAQCSQNGLTGSLLKQKNANKQLLKRNKYVVVIGSVIVIYTVYLLSYASIQFLYVSRLTSMFKTALSRTSMYYIRWIFQSLMCVHSLLQPLCYFRMREFRATFRAVICGNFGQAGTLSVTEEYALSLSENRNRCRGSAEQPLLAVANEQRGSETSHYPRSGASCSVPVGAKLLRYPQTK